MKSDKSNNEYILQEMVDKFIKLPPVIRKKALLIIIEKSNIDQKRFKKEFVDDVNNLKQAIENTGPIESNFDDFGHKELRCLIEIANRIDSYTMLNNRHTSYRSWGYYLLFMTITYSLSSFGIHAIFRPMILTNGVTFGTWIFISLMLSSGTFLLLNFGITLVNKIIKFKRNTTPNIFDFRYFFMMLGLSALINYLALYLEYYYLLPHWILPYMYPSFIKIIYGVLNLNFNSILVTISLVLSDIAAIIAALDFIKKRQERRQELTSFLSKIRNESL